ncbi:MAG: EamA family transporter [Chloroflexota bacterium]|nr:EamA family transporter [Chloroflexota bacterium]
MALLALHIVFNVGFALSTRVAQFRRYDYFLVAAVNYTLAAVVASLWALLRGGWDFDAPTLIFGAVQGFQYAATMIGVYLLLVRSGVGVTFIVLRLTVVVPTLSAIVFFGERPSAAAIGGLLLMLISIPLLVGPRSAVRGPRSRWYWPSVALMMVVTGAGLTASKAFNELSTPDRAPDFVMFSFLVSVPVALAIFAMRRRFQARTPPLRQSFATAGPLATGAAMGLCNVIQLAFLVAALEIIPGTIAFPIQTSASVLLTTAAGVIVWHERHGPIVWAGVAAALAGMVIVNV